MTDIERGLLRAVREGARDRIASGRRRLASWNRRVVPASVLLRATVGLAYFIAAQLAVPAAWGSSAAYLIVAAGVSLFAAFAPAGPAPLVASLTVVAAWLATTSLVADHEATLWLAAPIALLLYTAHSAAAIAQRFRTTTAVDGEIILTWGRHLGIISASTVFFALALALFTAYFAAIPATVAVAIGLMAAVTVIYVLARSLHNSG